MLTVYICGPFSDEPMRRTLEAADIQHKLMDQGYSVFCPHTSYFWTDQIRRRPYEEWMTQCLAMVAKCDILVRLPGVSPGSDREVALAESLGIPVVYGLQGLAEFGEAA